VLVFAWTMLPQDGGRQAESEDPEDGEEPPAGTPRAGPA